MNIITTNELNESQKQAIYHLWNNEYPARIGYTSISDFDDYLNNLNSQKHYLFADDGNIKGWMFTFTRDEESWFAIILDSDIHGKGYGTQLLDMIKATTGKLNGWAVDHDNDVKHDGSVYKSPLDFYLKNNFVVNPGIRLDTEKISAVKISWKKFSKNIPGYRFV